MGDVPIHLSSPFGYRLKACSPLNRGDKGPFSKGYMIVYGGLKNCSRTMNIPIQSAHDFHHYDYAISDNSRI